MRDLDFQRNYVSAVAGLGHNGTVWVLTIMVLSLLVYLGMIGLGSTDRIVLVAGIQK